MADRPLPESLAREGWAMLRCIAEDFGRIDGCEVITTLDERLAGRSVAANEIEIIGDTRSERQALERWAALCDWTILIAPESKSILLERVRWVEQAGGRLLSPASSAVCVASDKLRCSQLLQAAGVPAVVGEIVCPNDLLNRATELYYPLLLKPRDGAGSQATVVVGDMSGLASAVASVQREAPEGEFLLQRYVPGLAASAAFLIGPHGIASLLPGEQLLSDDGRLRYLGGRIPLDAELAQRAEALGRRAVAALPGLRGYVGVDMVLASSKASQPADVVIEINPRLTTSYVGLRHLARENLARRMVQIVEGAAIEPIAWRAETVGFSADGRIAYEEAGPGSSA